MDILKKDVSYDRDESIDIMKGILISLVVLCHAQVNPNVHRFIYLFHMPVFFMISGYLWNDCQQKPFKPLLIRKMRSLYTPYVVCNMFYLVLSYLLPKMFDHPMAENTLIGFGKAVIKILLLRGRCSMSDVTWFIAVLLLATLEYYWICRLIEKKMPLEAQNILAFVIIFLLVVCGYFATEFSFNTYQLGTMCSSLFALHLGNMIRKHDIKSRMENKCLILVLTGSVGALTVLFIINCNEIRLIDNAIVNPLYYTAATIAGWFLVYPIATFIKNYIPFLKDTFIILGRHSLAIMCFHFLAFKIVAVVQCDIMQLDYSNIANFPIAIESSGWWIMYTLVGISVPLTFSIIWGNIKGRASSDARK